MIELVEKGVDLANHYGISLLLVFTIVFIIRLALSTPGKWEDREHYYYELQKISESGKIPFLTG